MLAAGPSIGRPSRMEEEMKEKSFWRRSTAALVAVALVPFGFPARAASPAASLSGTVVAAAGTSLGESARVHAGDPKTGSIYSSGPIGSEGTFRIEHLPPATYELAVESNGGLYVVEAPIELPAGSNRIVHLEVKPSPARAAAAGNPQNKEKRKLGVWDNPLTSTLIVVGIAVVVGLIIEAATEEEGAPPSPSGP